MGCEIFETPRDLDGIMQLTFAMLPAARSQMSTGQTFCERCSRSLC